MEISNLHGKIGKAEIEIYLPHTTGEISQTLQFGEKLAKAD
jgi:hypothetical protein